MIARHLGTEKRKVSYVSILIFSIVVLILTSVAILAQYVATSSVARSVPQVPLPVAMPQVPLPVAMPQAQTYKDMPECFHCESSDAEFEINKAKQRYEQLLGHKEMFHQMCVDARHQYEKLYRGLLQQLESCQDDIKEVQEQIRTEERMRYSLDQAISETLHTSDMDNSMRGARHPTSLLSLLYHRCSHTF